MNINIKLIIDLCICMTITDNDNPTFVFLKTNSLNRTELESLKTNSIVSEHQPCFWIDSKIDCLPQNMSNGWSFWSDFDDVFK